MKSHRWKSARLSSARRNRVLSNVPKRSKAAPRVLAGGMNRIAVAIVSGANVGWEPTDYPDSTTSSLDRL
jgi:hypothetical protein